MTNVEDIYRITLEELAAEGNERAKLALAMGAHIVNSHHDSNDEVIRTLQYAQDCLHRAIEANATKWTSSTDKRINEAQAFITNAIIQVK